MSSARATMLEHGELVALPLYSSLPPDRQQLVFQPAPPPPFPGGKPARKVVVSTNVAETSITIDGIVYVIDPGLGKQKVFNPRLKVESLLVAPISKASASQRCGRAGRTRPGKCYRLFTEESWDSLNEQTYPELLRSELSGTVLQLLKLGIDDLVHFDFLDPPAPETLMHALMHLRHLGALDEEMKLTPMGKLITEFPLDACSAKCVITSGQFKCSAEIISIVAMLSVNQVFVRGKEKERQDAQKAKDSFAHQDGDHLQLLNVFQAYSRMKTTGCDMDAWCMQNYLNRRTLKSAESVRAQLQGILQKLAIPVLSPVDSGISAHDPQYHVQIQKAILAGFFVNVARLSMDESGKNKDNYFQLKDLDQIAAMHPGTCLKFKPNWVVYADMQHTSKNFIRTVTKINPEWLWEICPAYLTGGKLPNSPALKELMQLKDKAQVNQAGVGGPINVGDNYTSEQFQQAQAMDIRSQAAATDQFQQQDIMRQHMEQQQLLQQQMIQQQALQQQQMMREALNGAPG